MDIFTNFLVSSAVPVVIWAVGALYIRATGPDPMRYIQWLKINALAFFVVSTVVSLSLFALFPDPGTADLTRDLIGVGGLPSTLPSTMPSDLDLPGLTP